ncbi:MAG: HDOD domain-containing protein [Desulfobacter sp.]|nr:HDOD domain-containing protein [Desulfobacter sp.]WDP84704.1 MAG: HDOD domain-containing protein [Desulfobacter sp.]
MTQNTTILDTLAKYIENQSDFPVLNPDAARLQNEIIKPDPDLDAVKKLIRTDPTLTSKILKVANSPYYRGLGEVSTIKEAALRMGQAELFNMIMQVIHKQNFRSKNPMIKGLQTRLWDHCVACAFASLWLTRHLKMDDLVSKAFIAGLLHDMGKLCLLSALEKVLASKEETIKLTPDLVGDILTNRHETQGYALLTQWKLPVQYCNIARDHHIENYDESDSLLLVVRLADMICKKMDPKNQEYDMTYIMGSREADILGIKETGIALLEIAMEDASVVQV